jgi:hypothetical protein
MGKRRFLLVAAFDWNTDVSGTSISAQRFLIKLTVLPLLQRNSILKMYPLIETNNPKKVFIPP